MSRLLIYRIKVSKPELDPNKWRDHFIRSSATVRCKKRIIQPGNYRTNARICLIVDDCDYTLNTLGFVLNNENVTFQKDDNSRETEIANEMSRNINFDWFKFMPDDLPFYLRRIIEIGYLDLLYKYRRHTYGELILGLKSPIDRAILFYMAHNVLYSKAQFPLPVNLLYNICKKYSVDDTAAICLANQLAKKL